MNSYLLDKLNFTKKKLKKTCPALFLKQGKNGEYDFDIEYTGDEDEVLKFQKQYYKIVEKGNNYIEKLNNIEEQYFTAKYGPQIYEYIKKQRKKYIKNSLRGRKSNSSTSTATADEDNIDCNILYEKLKKEYEIYSNLSSDNFNQKIKTIQGNLNIMEDEIIQMNNQSEIDKRKLEYRSPITHQTIRHSNYVTIFYYFTLICIFLFLYVNNILYFRKNKALYIILIIIPLLYKYCFKLLVYLYNVIQNNIIKRGPKYAFLNDNDNLSFLDD